MSKRHSVIFLCTANANRSQMCEAWARALHGSWLDCASAGTRPATVHPLAIEVMREVGVDMDPAAGVHRSKSVEEFAGRAFDLVVTVCDHAKESCPRLHGAGRTLHQPFPDPPMLAASAHSHAEALAVYRRVRDQIHAWVGTQLPRHVLGT